MRGDGCWYGKIGQGYAPYGEDELLDDELDELLDDELFRLDELEGELLDDELDELFRLDELEGELLLLDDEDDSSSSSRNAPEAKIFSDMTEVVVATPSRVV